MRRSTTGFDPTALGKVEANFCLGNGYLGLRSATEEKYLGESRFYDKNYLQFTLKTIQSGITFVIDATHRFTVNGEAVEPKSDINILRRRMFSKFSLSVETGQLIKVWSGFIEIHITADVAYGVWQYYMCTGDQDFMDKYGYELMLDCAKFWSSRLESGEDGKLDGKLGLLLNQGAATVCSPRLDFVDLSVILRNSSRKRPVLLRAIP